MPEPRMLHFHCMLIGRHLENKANPHSLPMRIEDWPDEDSVSAA